jgi:hypothetical protein
MHGATINKILLCGKNLLIHQAHCFPDLTKINFDILDNAAFEKTSKTGIDNHR